MMDIKRFKELLEKGQVKRKRVDRARLLELLRYEIKEPVTIKELAKKLGVSSNTILQLLTKLTDTGEVKKVFDGRRNWYLHKAHLE